MMFRDTLYEVRGWSTDSSVEVAFIPDCAVYRAHFPLYPVTPGVCLIQIALELLSDKVGRPLEIVSIKEVKFMIPLRPSETPEATFNLSVTRSEALSCSVTVTARGQLFSRMDFTCA